MPSVSHAVPPAAAIRADVTPETPAGEDALQCRPPSLVTSTRGVAILETTHHLRLDVTAVGTYRGNGFKRSTVLKPTVRTLRTCQLRPLSLVV